MDELLDEYAELVVRVGVNICKGQRLVINAPLEGADFARRLAGKAYETGAYDVTVAWHDERFALLRYEKAPEAVFSEFPEWRRLMYMENAEKDAAFISIVAEDPEIFKAVAPERLAASQQSAGKALKAYRERIMTNRNAWCVVSVPSPAWAARVFPELTEAAAVKKLWEHILSAVRVTGRATASAAWQRHISFLRNAADFLNGESFRSLHYTNSLGTDLKIYLPEGHIWAGGAEYTLGGTRFVANIPTEEVYTMPRADGAEGIVYASRPLVYNGNVVDRFYLVFEGGKVTDFGAERGRDILKELLETDEGSCRLGEVALVPFDSPISRSRVLFYNTLFDENAACHLALGKAYPTCIKDGERLSESELKERGVNDSLLHEDFMIGTADLRIDGISSSGRTVPVFRDGNFAMNL